MNFVLLNNWNKNIRKDDLVFFLGDMSFGKNSRKANYWIKKLNGKIIFIEGNHENTHGLECLVFEKVIVTYQGIRFLLIHNASNQSGKNWIIHGHNHNNEMDKFPLVNPENKTINVSCELTNYCPLNMEKIIELISKKKRIMLLEE